MTRSSSHCYASFFWIWLRRGWQARSVPRFPILHAVFQRTFFAPRFSPSAWQLYGTFFRRFLLSLGRKPSSSMTPAAVHPRHGSDPGALSASLACEKNWTQAGQKVRSQKKDIDSCECRKSERATLPRGVKPINDKSIPRLIPLAGNQPPLCLLCSWGNLENWPTGTANKLRGLLRGSVWIFQNSSRTPCIRGCIRRLLHLAPFTLA